MKARINGEEFVLAQDKLEPVVLKKDDLPQAVSFVGGG